MTGQPQVFIVEEQVRSILDCGPGHREYAVGLELDQGEVFHIHVEQPTSPLTGFPCVAVVQVIERTVPSDEAIARARQAFDERLNQHPWWGAHHLVVTLLASDKRSVSARSYVFDKTGSPTEAVTAFVLSRPTPVPRPHGLPRCDALRQRLVAIVGLGTCASSIAVELAKAGVGRFVLIDHRRLDQKIIPQHICGISDLGRSAIKAVRDRLFDTNPRLICDTVDVDVSDGLDAVESHLRRADVLVSTSTNGSLHRRLNAFAIAADTPAILGLARPEVIGDEALRVRPFVGPCLACLARGVDGRHTAGDAQAGQRRSGDLRSDHSESRVRSTVFDTRPSIDASPMAALVVRLVLSELCQATDRDDTTGRDDTMQDHYVWVERHQLDAVPRSTPREGASSTAVLGWHATGAPRDPACRVCSSPMGL